MEIDHTYLGDVVLWDQPCESDRLARLPYYSVRELQYLKEMPYEKYLRTEHWQLVRREMARKHYGRCQMCGTRSKPINIHHLTYEHRGQEFLHLEDLTAVCEDCHRNEHEEGSSNPIHLIATLSRACSMDRGQRETTRKPQPRSTVKPRHGGKWKCPNCRDWGVIELSDSAQRCSCEAGVTAAQEYINCLNRLQEKKVRKKSSTPKKPPPTPPLENPITQADNRRGTGGEGETLMDDVAIALARVRQHQANARGLAAAVIEGPFWREHLALLEALLELWRWNQHTTDIPYSKLEAAVEHALAAYVAPDAALAQKQSKELA